MDCVLLAEWEHVLFIQYAVDPAVLQPFVPLPLDLWQGRAYVSLVAFNQKNLRPSVGGRLTELLCAPVTPHEFLNVRTYVRDGEERGIYFLAEYLPNRLAVIFGPRLYGLPCRLGRLEFRVEGTTYRGRVCSPDGRLEFLANVKEGEYDARDEFLLERYVAFTSRRGVLRRFQIWHDPWPHTPATISMTDDSLLRRSAPWYAAARLTSANYSPGLRCVRIGRACISARFRGKTPQQNLVEVGGPCDAEQGDVPHSHRAFEQFP